MEELNYHGRINAGMLKKARIKRQKPYFSTSLGHQIQVEFLVEQCFANFVHKYSLEDSDTPIGCLLFRDDHIEYLSKALFHLKQENEMLDASKPWLVYWILNSLSLLKKEALSEEISQNVIRFLNCCQNETGGFGGGPGQLSHLAPTFAAVNAVAILGLEEGFDMIQRPKLLEWLFSLKNADDNSFHMHDGGEADIRAVYCAMAVCRLLNIGFHECSLFEGTIEYILKCQTYEGGFGGAPGCEAHGGYTYCGIAALGILGRINLCNFDKALRWAAMRQMEFEGGFQGRTNKLVDGCYSFWVGALFILLETPCSTSPQWLFDESLLAPRFRFLSQACVLVALQEYILIACQNTNDPVGGLIDKPGKNPDYYHTCYTLSGLSLAQHASAEKSSYLNDCKDDDVAVMHPLHNITIEAAHKIKNYFTEKDAVLITDKKE